MKDITNEIKTDHDDKQKTTQARPARERRERGPPADGIPSKNKVMVANLPYDLTEEKVRGSILCVWAKANLFPSLRNSSLHTSHLLPRSRSARFPAL